MYASKNFSTSNLKSIEVLQRNSTIFTFKIHLLHFTYTFQAVMTNVKFACSCGKFYVVSQYTQSIFWQTFLRNDFEKSPTNYQSPFMHVCLVISMSVDFVI